MTKTAPKCDPNLKNSEFVWLEPYDYLIGTPNEKPTESSDIRGELVRAMNIQHVQPAKICGYWFHAKDSGLNHTIPASQDEAVVYYLHGGAYWMGSAHESSPNAGMNRHLLQRLSQCAGKVPERLFALEYRLSNHKEASDGSYPAALLDALVGYLYIIRACKFSAKNIVLMGDSSGGNLALALCRYLRDEQVAEMPGSMVLISPWSDVSRSHSGPIQAPNSFSTTVLNKNSDLIDPSIMYRNTSNCAFLGNLPASEAYLNPYISPVSLQLDYSGAGLPPHWGFQNFPKRIYIMTGTAELNNEQHLTLAHRLAQGTVRGVPEYVGDRVSAGEPVDQFTWREKYPRSLRFADSNLRKQHSGMWDDCPLEDREVVLDEVKDAIHVFPVFSWYEPERTLFIDRVVRWLAHEPMESGSNPSTKK
ncbi:hypothetical protein MYAM1_000867 [Malassezia yamatoensis]|uniref:Alpha/beta hydrolase fold-3 domain-containing protein n=1 Tax=Malassezia yamatoensis TaxID=253288 RepID=A0AAJ6CGW9_9BASI|nr:hypothetical protein MYAM1_000867 [Malassezia yamatoensis]